MGEAGAFAHRFGPRSPANSSPSVEAQQVSTKPVQLPQLAEALQVERTASMCARRPRCTTITLPLDTPLQPQISASSGRAATAR
jgi:hypothetical protein